MKYQTESIYFGFRFERVYSITARKARVRSRRLFAPIWVGQQRWDAVARMAFFFFPFVG